MSLLDVLKYPLSNPPTFEEINRLPLSILCKFNSVPPDTMSLLGRQAQAFAIHKFLDYKFKYGIPNTSDHARLKKLIKEYNT